MAWHHRWRNVFRSQRLDDELEAEFQYHLAETIDRLVSEGVPAGEAERRARVSLGNYGLQKERTRDMNLSGWLDSTRADLLYGLRQLRLSPGFTAVAVLSLALGIGANSAMFQLVNAIRLKMLPVKDPQELVSIEYERGAARSGWWTGRNPSFTYAQWKQLRGMQEPFSGLLAWGSTRFNLATGGEPRFAEGLYVSGKFFEHLGVGAVLGRTLNETDDSSPCNAGAVLSHAFWQKEFGGDPGVLGRLVSLDGPKVPIVGVTGPAFFGLEVGHRFDVAIPLCADQMGRIPAPSAWWLSVTGRLKPGWTADRASSYLRVASPAIMRATLPPEYNPTLAKRFLANRLLANESGTGVSDLRSQYERPLWLLMAITGLVLLIACANLANLLLARASVREREIAVRLAIGASRGRLVRQLLAESLLLAVAGAICGAGLSVLLSQGLTGFLTTRDNPVFVDASADWRLVSFISGLALLTCILFGLLPALRATVLAPSAAMRSGGGSMGAGRKRFDLRRGLVAAQIALSFVLLVGALLFVRTLNNLLTADAGFQPAGVWAVTIDFSKAPYPVEQRHQLYRQFQESLSAIAGVASVSQTGWTPVSDSSWDQAIGPDGTRAADSGKESYFNRTAPGYFRTMGTALLGGRDFDDHDTMSSSKVAIVNEVFAQKYFPGVNPVGRTFHVDADAGQPEPLFQIVGLVANTKYRQLREEFRPIAYFPVAQDPRPAANATFVLRVAGPPAPVLTRAKADVEKLSPMIGIEFRQFSVQLQESVVRERLMATLSGGFGILAGLLSTLGLYGVISYMVARRRSEIGLRMALGANPGQVVRAVFREAMVLLAVGLGAGVLIVLWAGQAAATLLYGLAPHDLTALLAAGFLLMLVACLASYLPARRAAAIDPMIALRSE